MASARMTEVYEKLYKAVCNQSTNNVITVANEIFHKPIMFVDEYFHVVSMHPAGPIGRPQWDAIYENKALNREQILRTLRRSTVGNARPSEAAEIQKEVAVDCRRGGCGSMCRSRHFLWRICAEREGCIPDTDQRAAQYPECTVGYCGIVHIF